MKIKYILLDKFTIGHLKIHHKLSFFTIYKIKKCIKKLDFDNLTISPNLEDPLRFYDIRFYKGKKLQLKIMIADDKLYNLENITLQLKAYLLK